MEFAKHTMFAHFACYASEREKQVRICLYRKMKKNKLSKSNRSFCKLSVWGAASTTVATHFVSGWKKIVKSAIEFIYIMVFFFAILLSPF
jgi:hypothetical protein